MVHATISVKLNNVYAQGSHFSTLYCGRAYNNGTKITSHVQKFTEDLIKFTIICFSTELGGNCTDMVHFCTHDNTVLVLSLL